MVNIIQLITPYLFHTGSWIYSQIIGLEKFNSIVFTQKKENVKYYPFNSIYSCEEFNFAKIIANKIYRKITDNYGLFFQEFVNQLTPSIFHAHMGYEAARWLKFVKKNKIPLITTFYGQDVSKLGRIPKWYKRYQELFNYGIVFLAEGNNLKKQLINLGCPEKKILIQHLGVNIDSYPQKEYSNSENERENKWIILQASTFREKKGIEYSLKAISLLRDMNFRFEYRLIGRGDSELQEEMIRSIIKKENLMKHVKLLGAIPHAEYLKELIKADIFLHPSMTASDGDNEGGAPVGIIEASAVGLPIISTFHADIPEVVINEQTGFLTVEKDFVRIAEKLSFLISNPHVIKEFGLAGREHIKKSYNISTQIKKLEDIYHDAINSN